jgi:2-iminobutanoate/2-iminopropanoate deaminase
MMSAEHASDAPRETTPALPLSPCIQAGEWVYVSGQVALDPTTGAIIAGDVTAQAERVFDHLFAVLHSAGKAPRDVVKVTVFLIDMDDYAAMNSVYARRFSAPYPARSAIAVKALPLGARIEIECVAR